MRDMGAVPLLTREGEVEIAKRIEDGEQRVFDLVFTAPFGRSHVRALRDLLQSGDIRVRTVVKLVEPDPVGDEDEDGDSEAEAVEPEAPISEEAELAAAQAADGIFPSN